MSKDYINKIKKINEGSFTVCIFFMCIFIYFTKAYYINQTVANILIYGLLAIYVTILCVIKGISKIIKIAIKILIGIVITLLFYSYFRFDNDIVKVILLIVLLCIIIYMYTKSSNLLFGINGNKRIFNKWTKESVFKKDQDDRNYIYNNYKKQLGDNKELIKKEKERITREYNSLKTPVMSYVMTLVGLVLTFMIKAFFDTQVEIYKSQNSPSADEIPKIVQLSNTVPTSDTMQTALQSSLILIIIILVLYGIHFVRLQRKITCAEMCLDVLNELEESQNKSIGESVKKFLGIKK